MIMWIFTSIILSKWKCKKKNKKTKQNKKRSVKINKGIILSKLISSNDIILSKITVGIRAQKSYIGPWALFKDVEYAEDEQIVIWGSNVKFHSIERVEGGPRRNSSSDMVNAAWVPILATRMSLQEAPLMGPCRMSMQKERNPKYLRKDCYHRIKCMLATFLTAFIWRRPLNSTVLTIATHRKLKKVSYGTSTQVIAQMINK